MFLLNSRHGLCTAARRGGGHPFSLSYGAILPSSLTRFLSRALVCSHLPTCVGLGYGRHGESLGVFLDSSARTPSRSRTNPKLRSRSPLGVARPRICLRTPPAGLDGLFRTDRGILPPAGSIGRTPPSRYGNINPLSIGYALRPGLRIRLTPGGRTCPGKPWNYGVGDSHPDFRYSCPHNHFLKVHRRFRSGFAPAGTLPYHPTRKAWNSRRRHRAYSRSFSARGHSTSQLLRNV
jgi:hypothetical protein